MTRQEVPNTSDRDALLQQRIIDGVGKRIVTQLQQWAEMKESACAEGGPPSLSKPVRATAYLAGEIGAAFLPRSQEVEALDRRIQEKPYHIFAAHRHVPVILPSNRRLIGAR